MIRLSEKGDSRIRMPLESIGSKGIRASIRALSRVR